MPLRYERVDFWSTRAAPRGGRPRRAGGSHRGWSEAPMRGWITSWPAFPDRATLQDLIDLIATRKPLLEKHFALLGLSVCVCVWGVSNGSDRSSAAAPPTSTGMRRPCCEDLRSGAKAVDSPNGARLDVFGGDGRKGSCGHGVGQLRRCPTKSRPSVVRLGSRAAWSRRRSRLCRRLACRLSITAQARRIAAISLFPRSAC